MVNSIEFTRKECNWVAFLHCDEAQLIVSSIGMIVKWSFIIVMTKELFLDDKALLKLDYIPCAHPTSFCRLEPSPGQGFATVFETCHDEVTDPMKDLSSVNSCGSLQCQDGVALFLPRIKTPWCMPISWPISIFDIPFTF